MKGVGMCPGHSRALHLGLYQYYLTTYFILCDIFTWCSMRMTTYFSGIITSSFVLFLASLISFCFCLLSCNSCVVFFILHGLSSSFVRVQTSMRRSTETLFSILPCSIITVCSCTPSTLYGPDVLGRDLLYRRSVNSSAAPDAVAAVCSWFMNMSSPILTIGFRRTFIWQSHSWRCWTGDTMLETADSVNNI